MRVAVSARSGLAGLFRGSRRRRIEAKSSLSFRFKRPDRGLEFVHRLRRVAIDLGQLAATRVTFRVRSHAEKIKVKPFEPKVA